MSEKYNIMYAILPLKCLLLIINLVLIMLLYAELIFLRIVTLNSPLLVTSLLRKSNLIEQIKDSSIAVIENSYSDLENTDNKLIKSLG